MTDTIVPGPWGGKSSDDDAGDRLLLKMAMLECSDLGNARRLQILCGEELAFVDGKWRGYDGRRWNAKDGERLAHAAAQKVAGHIWLEAEAKSREAKQALEQAARGGPDLSDIVSDAQKKAAELREWALDTGMASKASAMLKQAQVLLAADAESFDQHPLSFNVMNGTIWIEGDAADATFDLRPHNPKDRITKLSPVIYDPKAKCPKWLKHLEDTLPGQAERYFFHVAMGYTLTGIVREQMFWLHLGRGGDGKSTSLGVYGRVLGEYFEIAPVSLFLESRERNANEASPAMAALQGDIRMVLASEPGVGKTMAEDVLKQVTGGLVSARDLRQGQFRFRPHWKLHIESNTKPNIKSGDDGLFRRLALLFYPRQLDRAARIRGFEDELFIEASGILNWALQGARYWLMHGDLDSVMPESVRAAVDDYRRGGEPFREWFMDHMILDADAEPVEQAALYKHFTDWCTDNDIEKVMAQKTFGMKLSDLQIVFADRGGHKGRKRVKGGRLRTFKDGLAASGAPAADGETVAPNAADGDDDSVPPEDLF